MPYRASKNYIDILTVCSRSSATNRTTAQGASIGALGTSPDQSRIGITT